MRKFTGIKRQLRGPHLGSMSRQPERDETGLIIGVVVALATSPPNSSVMAPQGALQ